MKIARLCSIATAAFLLGCSGRHASVGAASATTATASRAAVAEPAGRATSETALIDKEHFTLRTIIDRQQGGLVLGAFMAPAGWPDQSQVIWNYAHTSDPVTAAMKVENPANLEAFYLYPNLDLFWLLPDTSNHGNGQNVGGLLHMRSMPPAATLAAFINQVRHGFQNLHFVGSKDLPGLPAALHLPATPNQRGIGAKITYDSNGRPTEEEFYAVYYCADIPYDGPQGRTYQRDWGLMFLHSFRAAKGDLDKRRAIFAHIAKSFRTNPAWTQRQAAINAYLAQQFNRQLQAGYDQIAAAGRLSRQISANNDAMLASIDARLQASRTSSSAVGGRSPTAKFDDYVRGVDTTDDPYYGTSQHSSNESYHWTDGYGSYRNSNDASYNPSQSENGNWTLMPSSR
jgi:hypothetical protein